MANVLFIIAAQGYQDLEYEEPKKVLEKKGHKVTTASTAMQATGSLGGTATVDILLPEAKVENYDAIAFIGGPGSSIYFNNETAHTLAKTFNEAGKLTCAICAGPITLAKAGLLQGKKATCYPGGSQDVIAGGAQYTGSDVEKDGNIITASGPPAAKKFGKMIVKNL
jgi:protease I